MGAEDDHAILFAGKTHDEVVQDDRADGGVGGEGVFFKLIVLEMVLEECFSLHMPGTRRPARTDRGEGTRIFIGFGAIEVLLAGRARGSKRRRRATTSAFRPSISAMWPQR